MEESLSVIMYLWQEASTKKADRVALERRDDDVQKSSVFTAAKFGLWAMIWEI